MTFYSWTIYGHFIYGLCPSQYLRAPGLSWDAIPKKTKIEFELFPDPDICIYSLKKVQEVEFLTFLIDTAKPAVNV